MWGLWQGGGQVTYQIEEPPFWKVLLLWVGVIAVIVVAFELVERVW